MKTKHNLSMFGMGTRVRFKHCGEVSAHRASQNKTSMNTTKIRNLGMTISLALSFILVGTIPNAFGASGRLVSWGLDKWGQVSSTPTGAGFMGVAGGVGRSVALRSDGTLVSWGLDDYGPATCAPTGNDFVAV